MSTGAEIPTNRYSIYMIKPDFEKLEDIVDSRDNIEIQDVGGFFFDQSHPRTPGWLTDFFGNALEGDHRILTSSARGVLIVPIKKGKKTVRFAVTFGFGRHLLKEGVVEERFGLKVVLNSLDPSSLRSIHKTTLGAVPKHSYEQMSRDVEAADFGIDIEQDLVSSVTGKSRISIFGSIITGKDSLSGSARIDITNIQEMLSQCADRYVSHDYKSNFEWIDQIAEVRDKKLIDELSGILIDKLNKADLSKVWMAVPEVVDWSDVKGFRYLRVKRGDLHSDLDMGDFLKAVDKPITPDTLKEPVFMISSSTDDQMDRWSAFRCTYAEVALGEEIYVLNNGKWYRIATSFTKQVQSDFDGVARSEITLPECTVAHEGDYNKSAVAALPGACCMDRKLIPYGGGHSSIEFCDILTANKQLIHVKRYGGSSVLSHLFAQGTVSGEAFVSDPGFREKLNVKLPKAHKLADTRSQPDAREYEVIYGIISDSENPLDIPFFSKVNLRNARRRLGSMGYKVAIKKIRRTAVAKPVAVSTSRAAIKTRH